VQIRELGQQPLGGLAHGCGAVDAPGLGLSERREGMFQVVLGHQLVSDGQVLAVPDVLEVAPDQLLVGL
jgi:hypothetical protein